MIERAKKLKVNGGFEKDADMLAVYEIRSLTFTDTFLEVRSFPRLRRNVLLD